MRDITIDRERALKFGALIGLVILGLSTLPGLLETPEPPPVPADVGFLPGEFAGLGKPRKPAREPKREPGARHREHRRPPRPRTRRAERRTSHAGPATVDEKVVAPVADPAPTPPPPPETAPPAPAPSPVPESPPAPPGDGSEEFAPR